MSASYDPGRWQAGPHCWVGDKVLEWRVCRVGGPLMMVTREEATALLAAAAPDMLTALRDAFAAIDAINVNDEAVGALNRAGLARDLARAYSGIIAAILQATGRAHG